MAKILYVSNSKLQKSTLKHFFFSLSRLIDLSSDELLSQNKLLPSPKSAKNLQVPKLTIKKVEECGDCIEDKRRAPFKRVFDLTVQTDAVALYVWLEAGGMYYSKVIIIY